jgi:hypothetical protein
VGNPEAPQLGSPASRYFPWQIKLPPSTDGDLSFQYYATRSEGLTPKETALLAQAHSYFGLEMGADGKIAGVLIFPNGTAYALVSGKHGGPHGGTQDGYVPRGPGSGITRFNVTHIEGHSSAIMYRVAAKGIQIEKMAEAALLIPKEPCGACDPNIPKTLPPGTRLFVVDPESTTIYRSTEGMSLEGMRFSRPSELQFNVPSGMVRLKTLGASAGPAVASAALSILSAWLRGKLDQSIIENRIRMMEPEIRKALQEKVDEVLELIGKKQKAYANVTIDIHTITNIEPEIGGPVVFTTSPAVLLKTVAISSENINEVGKEQHRQLVGQIVNDTPVTFSFEVGLAP